MWIEMKPFCHFNSIWCLKITIKTRGLGMLWSGDKSIHTWKKCLWDFFCFTFTKNNQHPLWVSLLSICLHSDSVRQTAMCIKTKVFLWHADRTKKMRKANCAVTKLHLSMNKQYTSSIRIQALKTKKLIILFRYTVNSDINCAYNIKYFCTSVILKTSSTWEQ